MQRTWKLLGMLKLVGTMGVFVVLASTAVAGTSPARQLTGKVTSVNRASITVRSSAASLTCRTRAGQQLKRFAGKRVTMSCRAAGGKLVVRSIAAAGAAKPSQQQRGPAPSSTDPADDDASDDDGTDSGDSDDGDDSSDDSSDDGDDDDSDDDSSDDSDDDSDDDSSDDGDDDDEGEDD